MLHLKVPIRSGTCYGEIEYENPLQKTKEEYYTARLHSLYASAAETRPVNVPITITIQDSSYIANIDSEEINFDQPIKEYSQKIANLLSGSIQNRASRKFIKTLKNFSPNIPSASYTEASDNDVNSRFFSLALPKRTFLYSNSIAPLYALGYAQDQIQHIPDLFEYTDIPRQIIENSQIFGPHTNLKSIYIVVDNTTNSYLPVTANEGRLKWLEDDKFESVYFPQKRQERYINTSDIPRERINIRRKRQAPLSVNLSQIEVNAEIKDTDTKQVKLANLKILKKWDTAATQVAVVKPGQGKNFNPSDLTPQGGETAQEAKLKYWRKKIVESIVNLNPNYGVPEVIVPVLYYGVDANEILAPLKTLGDLDPKSYVRIGANACLLSFYTKYLGRLDQQLKKNPSLSNTLKQSIKASIDKYTEEHTNRFKIQGNAITTAIATKNQLETKIKNEVDNGAGRESAESAISAGEGVSSYNAINGSQAVTKLPKTAAMDEEEEEDDDDAEDEREEGIQVVTAKLVDDTMDKLQELDQKTTQQKDTVDNFRRQTNTQLSTTKIALESVITLFNDFLTSAQSESPPTVKQVLAIAERGDELEQEASAAKDEISRIKTSIQQIIAEHSLSKAIAYLDFLKSVKDNPNINNSIKDQVDGDLPTANGYKKNIKIAIDSVSASLRKVITRELQAESNHRRIYDISIDLNSYYNKLLRGEVIQYPAPIPDPEFEPTPAKKPKTEANPVTTTTTTSITTKPTDSLPTSGTMTPSTNLSGGESGSSSSSGGNQSNQQGQLPPSTPTPPTPPTPPSPPNDYYDERTADNFDARKKYSIGFIHFKNEPYVVQSLITVSKDTKPLDICNAFKGELDTSLLENQTLNMTFKPQILEEYDDDNPQRYVWKNNRALDYNNSYMKIDLKDRRYANLMRMSALADSFQKVTLFANNVYSKYSDNFEILDPFENDFFDHLPLILSPVNAGPFNSYSSISGEMTTMGIVEAKGRVKNSVELLMRSSERERFSVMFYSGKDLQKKYFSRDYILYFHFNVNLVS